MKLVLLLLALCGFVNAQDFIIDTPVSTTQVTATHITAGGISGTNISATGNASAAKFIGDGSLLSGISAGSTSPSWYAVQNVPQPVQDVSTGLKISVTTVNGQYASFTALAVGGQSITATPSWYSLLGIPTAVQNISTGLIVSTTTHNGQYASFTTINGSLSTAAQPNVTSVGTLTALAVSGNSALAAVSASNVSASGNVSAVKFIGDGSLLTGIAGGGGGTSPSWYAVQNIPQSVQDVSTGLKVSVTTVNGQYASFTTIAGTFNGTIGFSNPREAVFQRSGSTGPAVQINFTSGVEDALYINNSGTGNTINAGNMYVDHSGNVFGVGISGTSMNTGTLTATGLLNVRSISATGNISMTTINGISLTSNSTIKAWATFSGSTSGAFTPSATSNLASFNRVGTGTYQFSIAAGVFNNFPACTGVGSDGSNVVAMSPLSVPCTATSCTLASKPAGAAVNVIMATIQCVGS